MSLKIRELSHKSVNTVKELGDVASDLRELSGISLKTVKMLGDLSSRVVKGKQKKNEEAALSSYRNDSI